MDLYPSSIRRSPSGFHPEAMTSICDNSFEAIDILVSSKSHMSHSGGRFGTREKE